MSWSDDVRRANETLDWIEQRQGPLPEAGYARIQTTVGQVRAMAEGQDDARIIEIRELLAEVNTPVGYFPDLNEALDWAFALAGRIDALTAERDVLRVERDIARRVEQESSAAADAWQAEAVKVRAERDALRARAERAESALLEILREAAWEARLTEWRKHSVTAVGTQPTPQEACREVRAIARAALANAIEREAAS